MDNITLKYLPSAERDLTWGLAVNCVGFQKVGRGESYPPQNHPISHLFFPNKGRVLDEYQLIYIIKGSGVFKSEHTSERTIKAGDVMLLFPGERHSYHPDANIGWDEFWIGFNGPNIDSRVSNGFFAKEHPVFHVGISEDIAQTYRIAIDAAQQMRRGYQQMLAGCVNMLLGHIYTLDGMNEEGDHNAKTVRQAIHFMNENFQKDIHPEDVADAVNCGYSRFRKIFLEQTGISPYQHILKMRIQRSKELLTYTDKTLKEISEEVGFSNPLYFSTAFKRIENMSPSRYRKEAE